MSPVPFDYSICKSPKARHVRIRVSLSDGLVVVVPRGFPAARVPALLETRRGWIERALERVRIQREERAKQAAAGPPVVLALPALGEEWDVEYRPTEASGVSVRERPGRRLVVSGAIDDAEATRNAIRRWLARRAKATLAPRLLALAAEHDYPVKRVTMRWQRSRWGSCSPSGTISLNAQLLFLPSRLAEYVVLHELCHTVRLDHSAAFWRVLAGHEPRYETLRRELRKAGWSHVPGWLLSE
jgi:predicted metal-dependent hydrolase